MKILNRNFCVLGSLYAIQPLELNKGLVFLKDREILLTGDKWTIVLEISFYDYIKLIQGIQEAIFNVTEAISKIDDDLYLFLRGTEIQIGNAKREETGFKPAYESEIRRLARMSSEIEANVESFRALLPQTVKIPKLLRGKRGLANVIGYTIKYLFGTMDNRDMETINHFVDSMSMFAEKVVHTTE